MVPGVLLAILLTLLWLALVAAHIGASFGASGLVDLFPTDLAVLVLAVLGPILLFWIAAAIDVLARQNRLGRERTEALRREEAARTQALLNGLADLAEQSHRDGAARALDVVLRETNSHLAVLLERLGLSTGVHVETLWGRTAAGDQWAFSLALLDHPWRNQRFQERVAERLTSDGAAMAAVGMILRRWRMVADYPHPSPLVTAVLEDSPITVLRDVLAAVESRAEAGRPAAAPAMQAPATANLADEDEEPAPEEPVLDPARQAAIEDEIAAEVRKALADETEPAPPSAEPEPPVIPVTVEPPSAAEPPAPDPSSEPIAPPENEPLRRLGERLARIREQSREQEREDLAQRPTRRRSIEPFSPLASGFPQDPPMRDDTEEDGQTGGRDRG